LILAFGLCFCERFSNDREYTTRNVIVLVIDGARYSETRGDKNFTNIPRMKLISESGVLFTNFQNLGPTYILAGQTALTTGNYQEINNTGTEIPEFP
jgi:arylsulfatase A-like enzyme